MSKSTSGGGHRFRITVGCFTGMLDAGAPPLLRLRAMLDKRDTPRKRTALSADCRTLLLRFGMGMELLELRVLEGEAFDARLACTGLGLVDDLESNSRLCSPSKSSSTFMGRP